MEQPSYTQRLADFVANTTYDDLPTDVIESTKRLILDTLGCTVGGFVTERQKILLKMVKEMGGAPEATILATGDKVPCTSAAMVNVEAANALEGVETFLNLGHLSPVVVTTALAIGERAGATGKDLITAVAVGYDIAARLELARVFIRIEGGELQSSTVGGLGYFTIAAAATAGKILGLDSAKMVQVIGIAGATSTAPSNMKLLPLPQMTMLKYGSMYAPIQAGITAALLAEKGYTGDPTILDTDIGFFHFHGASETDWELLVNGLGEKWWILEAAYKVYPSCRFVSGPLDLFYKMKQEHQIKPEEIENITVAISPVGMAVPSEANPCMEPDPDDPCTQLDSVFNIPFLMSLAALDYKPGPEWYIPQRFNDPEIRGLMAKVKVEMDLGAAVEVMRAIQEEPTRRSKKNPCTLTVTARGEKFEDRAEYAKGDPWVPETRISDEELIDKFRIFTEKFISMDKQEKAIETVFSLENLGSVSELAQLLVA